MWNKIKEWFTKNWKSFTVALIITLAFIFFIALLPKWLIILIASLTFVGITAYKIWKDQPF